MSKLINLIGQKFGRLTVMNKSSVKIKNGTLWTCQCSCGTIKDIRGNALTRKKFSTKSCGCFNEENRRNTVENLIGQIFGKLIVIERAGSTKHGRATWKCQCCCYGPNSIIIASAGDLKHTNRPTKSCGCSRIENAKRTHPKEENRFYKIWYGIIYRCINKKSTYYHRYGGRGITFQNSWKQYKYFKNDMYKSYLHHVQNYGEKETSIDRINNDGNYTVNNTRWVTNIEQNMNKSINNSKYFKAIYILSGPSFGYKEISNNQREFARKYNLNRVCIGNCIRDKQISHKGWTFKTI